MAHDDDPNDLNATIVQGNDVRLHIQARRRSDNSIIDLTGCSLIWTLMNPQTGEIILNKTSGAGEVVITDATDGQIIVIILAADTLGLMGDFIHQPQIIDPIEGITDLTNRDVTPGMICIMTRVVQNPA